MSFGSSYQNTLAEISEIAVWTEGCINIEEANDTDISDFIFYREYFKKKYEEDKKSRSEFVKACFDFAKKAVEIICKTMAGAFGNKTGNIGK